MKTKIVNLYAGPGTGKSTTATSLFSELKYLGINCEYVAEGAKDAAWEGRSSKYWKAQQFIYGEQSWRMERLQGEVDIIVTDCPILMGLVYMPADFSIPALRDVLRQDYDRYDNLDVFLNRNKPFNPKGRTQTEEQAKTLDSQILTQLSYQGVETLMLNFSRDNPIQIIQHMVAKGWAADIPKLKG